jgi:hypothetical protein
MLAYHRFAVSNAIWKWSSRRLVPDLRQHVAGLFARLVCRPFPAVPRCPALPLGSSESSNTILTRSRRTSARPSLSNCPISTPNDHHAPAAWLLQPGKQQQEVLPEPDGPARHRMLGF